MAPIGSSKFCRPNPYAERVPELLASGADALCAEDEHGNTALYYASRAPQLESVPLLLEAGADPAHKNANGESALDVAKNEQIKALLLQALLAP